ncbi:hypothetical protein CJU90_6114 [Yarrowia sp. C11]|nr:hypothetical protein CJU90_6114 [Yarrowia sp. C11]KAG5370824.1 hypothetical protein CKK34_0954 [Yarrowia sp. E02]
MLRVKKGRATYLASLGYKRKPPLLPDDDLPSSPGLYHHLDCPSSLWQDDHKRFVAFKGPWSFLDGGRTRKAGNDVRYGREVVNRLKTAAVNAEGLSAAQQRRKMVSLMALGVRLAARKAMPIKYVDQTPRSEDALDADRGLLGQAFGALESALHVDLNGDILGAPPTDCEYLMTRRIWRILGKTTLAPALMGYALKSFRNTNAHPQLLIDMYSIFAQTQYVYSLPIGNAWAYQLNLDRFFRYTSFHVCPSTSPTNKELAFLAALFSKYNHETGLPPNVPFCGRIEAQLPANWLHVFLQILRDRQYPCDGRTFSKLALKVSKVSPSARQDLVDYHLQQSQRWWYQDESIFSLMYLMCNRGDAEASIEVMNSAKFSERLLDEKTRMGAFRMLLYRAVKFEGMRDAVSVFQTMKEKGCAPDLQCYGLLIHGYKERGYYEEAISHTLDVANQSYIPVEIATDYFEAVAKSKDLKETLAVYCQLYTPHSLLTLGIFAYVLRGSAHNHIAKDAALRELPQLGPKLPGFRLYKSDVASLHILYRALLEQAVGVEQVRDLYEKYRDLVAKQLALGKAMPARWKWLQGDVGFALMSSFVSAILRLTGDISQCLLLVRDFIHVAKVNMFAPEVFNTLVTASCYSGRFDLAEEALRLAMAINTPTNKVVFIPLDAHIRAGRLQKAEVFWNLALESNDVYSYLEQAALLLPVADEKGWTVPTKLRKAVEQHVAEQEAKKEAKAEGYAKDDAAELELQSSPPQKDEIASLVGLAKENGAR